MQGQLEKCLFRWIYMKFSILTCNCYFIDDENSISQNVKH